MSVVAPVPARFLDENQSLACIHCGLCLSACPTYLETGDENNSPRGRIYLMRAVQDGRLPLAKTAVRHIDLCLGCRACEAACPSGVHYGDLLEGTRDHVERSFRRQAFQSFLRRVAIEQVFPFPFRTKLALLPARFLRALRVERLLPKFARDALSLLPEKLSAAPLPELALTTAEPRRGRVGFLRGCVASVLFGDTNAASVALLNRAGYDVLTPTAQGCCGALYAHSGSLARARACARHNIAEFEPHALDAIITNAAGCGSTLKEYGHLLASDPALAARAAAFSAKVKDLSEWLAASPEFLAGIRQAPGGSAGPSRVPLRPTPAGTANRRSPIANSPTAPASSEEPSRLTHHTLRVTLHDACHLAHAQRITKPPRDLVRAVAGDNFVELPESDVCCGSAGSYNLTEPEMAERLQRRKTANILQTGAQIVVTTNPGCILQIQAGLRKAGAAHVRVQHLADFLKAALDSEE
ncbi:MAG: 4Fe-4S dicluster domain-containing protein [Verrucomicrobia bacterium]|nr:4Fe-4S dicluster domain-containing protein [Verrucomicrobiota bacterium]